MIAAERVIARLRDLQIQDLAELDVAQVATADGSRSLSEWVASRLDVGNDTAKTLVQTMRRLHDRPDLEELLADGSASFDRIEALSRISDQVGLMEYADVAGVRREAARRARVSAEAEHRTAKDRFLVMQPSLDESWWNGWFGLDGPSGALVEKVLSEKADQLPDFPDGIEGDSGWRRATALVETMFSDEAPPANVTVIVDAKNEGANLEAGPNVGREALQALLCDADTELVARASDGRFMDYGRKQRTAPPALKRALIHRSHGICQADGCTSRHRLQIHHIVPWSHGGPTDQENLVVLCWFHHQVVVHERGFEIYFHHGRRVRFRRPRSRHGSSQHRPT